MKRNLYLFIITLLSAGCAEKISTTQLSGENLNEQDYVTSSRDGMMVLGKKLNNPYSLANMQAAYNELCKTKSVASSNLEATDLYVRFLPKDSTDIAVLSSLDLELFDYPLDYEILSGGDYYHDPTIPETEITWQYTKVSPDFKFPDMQYEILDECFIPEDEEELTKSSSASLLGEELEMMAIRMAGQSEEYSIVETKASAKKYPAGYVKINTGSSEVPVKGVKVRCHFFLKWTSDYTDGNGYYKVSKKFSCKPHYSVILENQKGFVVWGNWGFLSPATHNDERRSTSGYNFSFTRNDKAWKWLVINNAAYDYYRMCEKDGIKKPPTDLKIWCWKNATSSSAPMLHHLVGLNVTAFAVPFAAMLLTGPVVVAVSTLSWFLMAALPDVTIGTYSSYMDYNTRTYSSIYGTVWHELTHASHFSQAGESLWGRYVNYIVTHSSKESVYGDGSADTKGRDICELGEAWANAFESYSSYTNQNDTTVSGLNYWFKDGIRSLYYLMYDSILTTEEIYRCLTKDVKSIEDLKQKLLDKYEDRSEQIEAYF